jgi:antitoxin component of MazEF toxin-antitoxin module
MRKRKTPGGYIRNLTRISGGTSYSIIIPMEYVNKLGLEARQQLEVKMYGKGIIVRPIKEEKAE